MKRALRDGAIFLGITALVWFVVLRQVAPAEIRAALEKLSLRYAPEDSRAHREAVLKRELPAVVMVEIAVDHMDGKEAIELVRIRHALE